MWNLNIERKSQEYSKLPYLMPRSPMLFPIETILSRDLLNHSLFVSSLFFSLLFHLLQLLISHQIFDSTATTKIRINDSIMSPSTPPVALDLVNRKPESKKARAEASSNSLESPPTNSKVSLGCMRDVRVVTVDLERYHS